MKNRLYLIVAVFLLLGAILLFQSVRRKDSHPDNFHRKGLSSAELTSESESVSDSGSKSNISAKSSKPLKKATPINSIQRLREIGYVIAAAHIDEFDAEGTVKIITPDGTKIGGNKLSFSPDKELFFITGSVELVSNKEKHQLTLESASDEAFIEICPVQGSFATSPHGWSFGSKTKK